MVSGPVKKRVDERNLAVAASSENPPQRVSAGRCRMEWNGVSGWRQVRIEQRLHWTAGGREVERDERTIGEVCEPLS